MQLPSADANPLASFPSLAITKGAQMRAIHHRNKVDAANNVITQSLHIGVHSLRARLGSGHC